MPGDLALFLSDNETRLDLLNHRVIADSIVALISQEPERPISIGVHGDWGAGKSSILLMVEESLRSQEGVLCLTFNGWLFQGFEDAKVVVIEQIVQGLEEARPQSEKVKDAARAVLKRIDWLRAARRAGGLAWTAFTGLPDPALALEFAGMLDMLRTDPKKVAEEAGALASKFSGLLKEPEPRHLPKEIHDFRAEFNKLLDAADVQRLVVLIDDLDRCLPSSAIETLEAIRLFLWMPRSAFVVGADERMIEYAVREHFPDLPPSSGPLTYTRNYLEKLIQVPFRIPALGEQETRVYVTLLLLLAELGEEDEGFARVANAAREVLNRPWQSSGLQRADIEGILGKESVSPGIHAAITLSSHVGRVLARGSSGNPRQVKRFLNSWLLRYAIAEQRGFGEMIKRDALAKIVLAERFMQPLFDGIASEAAASPNGRSNTLNLLEVSETDGRPETLPEWVRDEASAREWARIEPYLRDVDLRPYVFITRDRGGRVSIITLDDAVTELAARLRGTEMAVMGAETDVRKLTGDDPMILFNHLRESVLQAEDLTTKPDGIQGLALLAKHHPALRPPLLELLGELPADRLGTWVITGWAELFDGDLLSGFNSLRRGWAANERNTALSRAAKAALRIR